jgi:HD superfamily phosphohydrolase
MAEAIRKIINDPVYGFITIDHPLIFDLIQQPCYQRLRRIHQMALAHLVYPGAVHSRFHHSLGAYHLMNLALHELKGKGVIIEPQEEIGAKAAILLHDIGHGPYSHALEQLLVESVPHEVLSQLLMESLNHRLEGRLETAIQIFNTDHPKKFLHQLVSSQLDVDRMDYLSRDSFYTGVHEGVIGYDRILKMLTVHDGALMVEEKGIYSIEKFLVARRLMHWQVYLHKTVLSSESLLVKIISRAKMLTRSGTTLFASPALQYFLSHRVTREDFREKPELLELFCKLDDYDIMAAVKAWADHPDPVLSLLCTWLTNRRLFTTELSFQPFEEERVEQLKKEWSRSLEIPENDMNYFVFTGTASNNTYDSLDEKILILFKNGLVKDISSLENALINNSLSNPIKKFYICYPK